MAIAYIALGANLRDRRENIAVAVARIGALAGTTVLRQAEVRVTAPVGGPPQGDYLNSAVEVETGLSPEALMGALLEIERGLGRERAQEARHGARVIDLDLIFYGDVVCCTALLTLPHPRMQERLFVLDALADIAPELVHPVLKKTVGQMRRELMAAVA